MESEALSDENNTTSWLKEEEERDEGSAPRNTFNWQASDAAFLRPKTLHIPKVQRAWDRKPSLPFSKQKLRVGKVWKRSQAAFPHSTIQNILAQGRTMKRRKARSSLEAGMKAVKKMCVDTEFGLGAQVLQWDGFGSESPARKIVTRRSAALKEEEEGLVALPEDEENVGEFEEEGDVTIEILDEDGTVVEVNPGRAGEEAEWEDEIVEEDELSNGTITRVEDVVQDLPQEVSHARESEEFEALSELDTSDNEHEIDLELLHEEGQLEDLIFTPSDNATDAALDSWAAQQVHHPPQHAAQNLPLPPGFVSPAKRTPTTGRKARRSSFGGSRRRTLPVQFAPAVFPQAFAPSPLRIVQTYSNLGEDAEDVVEVEEIPATPDGVVSGVEQEMSAGLDERAWEDVGVSSSVEQAEIVGYAPILAGLPEMDIEMPLNDTADLPMLEDTDESPMAHEELPSHMTVQLPHEIQSFSPSKLPSSPIPTIERQHPRLPLRRSPRRKSSSPRKQSTILPSTEKPHLVAFTPLGGIPHYQPPGSTPQEPEATDTNISPPPSSPLTERASSAPPSEPQISAQKPSRPRVSDDTALLQAFLNRAAESKNGSSRRISATKRDSIANRRDSDAIRQALASPAKADVLMDLDPNSPSPRKSSTSADTGGEFDGSHLDGTGVERGEAQDDETLEDAGLRTRRSGRAATKRFQPSSAATWNKISIRGNAEGIVLKGLRSKAQELALMTRNNTKKNKGGAVLPPLRLTKLASSLLGSQCEAENSELDAKAEGVTRAGVKWAETLVEYFHGGEGSEISLLNDEPCISSSQTDLPGTSDKMDVETGSVAVTAPPPSETPSKPNKIRRLKAPRTAATPGKVPAAPPQPLPPQVAEKHMQSTVEAPAPSDPQPKPAATTTIKRRSRIATPAKGLRNGPSLLPGDFLDPKPVVPTNAGASGENEKMIPSVKKEKKQTSLISSKSKLPAPASTQGQGQGQGKENKNNNLIISSPPKKKQKSTTTTSLKAIPTPAATAAATATKTSSSSFTPRLDFGGNAAIPTPSSSSSLFAPGAGNGEAEARGGLGSPAKKNGGRRKGGGEEVGGVVSRVGLEMEMEMAGMGLSSPAKKRTRRGG